MSASTDITPESISSGDDELGKDIGTAIVEWAIHTILERAGPPLSIEGIIPKYEAGDALALLAEETKTNVGWWHMYAMRVADADNSATLGSLLRLIHREHPEMIMALLKAGADKFYLRGEDDPTGS